MAKARSLIEDVAGDLPRRKGFRPWYETLPADISEECVAIKAAWKEGRMGTKTGLARALSKNLRARGIEIGQLGVIRWLEKA
jgi:hypothetical protein